VVKNKKAIFFDRDGTLIKSFVSKKKQPVAIKKLKDFKLIKNVKFVVNQLSKKYYIIVITNQPDVSRGRNSKENVIKINLKLQEVLKIDKIYTSYSDNDKNYLRKPNPGMIYLAKKNFKLNLQNSYVVGDRDKDIFAGKKAKCKTVLIKKIYNNKNLSKPDFKIKNFKELLRIIKS
tara:strand:- start:36 stop:563 length:528 start_codon:yes stop_codon:yes gene_type:complete